MKRGLLCDVFTERRSDFNFGSGASEAVFEYYFLSVSPVEANNIRISENLIFLPADTKGAALHSLVSDCVLHFLMYGSQTCSKTL